MQVVKLAEGQNLVGYRKHNLNGIGSLKYGKIFYRRWYAMLRRCKRDVSYKKRGILVCDRWKDILNFKEDMYGSFVEHCNEFGEGDTSLDRINGDENYSLDNCRWVRLHEQKLNTKASRYNFVCSVENCEKRYNAMGFCGKHYARFRRHGDPMLVKKGGELIRLED